MQIEWSMYPVILRHRQEIPKLLREAGYEIKKISLVDQFPHTAHIETVVLFEK